MAKKNSFGKFLALTTTAAAIGGLCYVFRDQIKESSIYKKSADKLSSLKTKMSNHFSNEDDFFFDDDFDDDFNDDIFEEDAKSNREYTSITINPKDDTTNKTMPGRVEDVEETIIEHSVSDKQNTDKDIVDTTSTNQEDNENSDEADTDEATAGSEDMKEIFADDSIPTISFGANASNASAKTQSEDTEVLGYENEGLSDAYEDPDVLEDQDKLDF